MTNAELLAKIRQEIERRITDNTFGAKLELIDILAWLDTLESEKPMQEGLEEEIATYLKDWEDDEEIGLHLSTDNGCVTIELDDIRDLARHFAQWGAEHAKIDVTDFCKPIDPGTECNN